MAHPPFQVPRSLFWVGGWAGCLPNSPSGPFSRLRRNRRRIRVFLEAAAGWSLEGLIAMEETRGLGPWAPADWSPVESVHGREPRPVLSSLGPCEFVFLG